MVNQRLYELSMLAEPPFLSAASGTSLLVATAQAQVLSCQVAEGKAATGLEAMLREARRVQVFIDAGVADPIEIDRAAKASLAIRLPVMGVVARYDFTGLDATWNNIQGEPIHLASGDDHSPALKRLVEAGHYGVKTGQGFFDWRGRDQKELLQERDLRLLQVRKLMKQWE